VSTSVAAPHPRRDTPDPAPSGDPGAGLAPLAVGPVLLVAGGLLALEMLVAGRYGFHRDELYFLACARHLAWGYVDQPPLVPAVARLSTALFGNSVIGLRLFPALAATGVVFLAALMARELGGKRRAQVLAGLAVATAAEMTAMVHLLSTAAFDLFFWAGVIWLVLRLLRTGDPRWWMAIGAVTGVGLHNKDNIAFLLVGIGIGFVIGGRFRLLLNRWLVLGVALALVLVSPNLVWNAQHHWAAVEMTQNLHTENSGLSVTLAYLPIQLIVVGVVLLPFWLAGLIWLLRSPFARPLGIAYLALVVIYALSGGKSYYQAGIYLALFAAGGVVVERRVVDGRRPSFKVVVAAMLVGLLISLPLTLPVIPASGLATGSWEGQINKDLSATVGWPQFVDQIAGVAAALPAPERKDLVVYTGDYGAAGAIDLYGSRYGLPHAISGHNTYWLWGPAGATDGATTIAVNLPRAYLESIFTDVTPAGTVTTPHDVWTEERGAPIYICSHQRETWAQLWPRAKHYG
jgi:Dolichyl-phosphate-mannose-protein mannosyltransferase